ncbi:hypothetical protein ACN23B_24025 [Anabaena sp. FACHB-709]|uniref:Uncharacterized protein n=2 Tax=Nostocaceae TaxID=1162 RepID=A0A1Z4KN72_ANAVA|nr:MULTISPECIES: hypothetical protein [Nostocaceae]BAY70394.1 hypothetical protein NIES23_31980 [Trichormus variabilis NIES-23]HBW29004.1 hypothetical protein [Nostoc sp. UBA8866]MBD2174330.1 hypothetical protein [Anabaena cylindrica FACHB-318]MBD2266048.1 hypothetical protein [Anabaena sp. FACHB-709]MBD2275422.1 hypothetical protein [Nostoc sp. PCC 7120 = FACHB-418]
MANNNNLFNFTPEFLSQLIFGAFLIFILITTGSPLSLSIFLGIIGGFALGWFTNSTKSSPQAPVVASSDGIDAGLKYWLFFLLGFGLLGYPAPMSILLGGIGAVGGGWIIAWWRSKEETKTQLPVNDTQELESDEISDRITKRQTRRPVKRYRRGVRNFNFPFLGNNRHNDGE